MNYFNRLQDFLAGLDQPLQLSLLGLFLLVFLFAFILGLLLRAATLKRYKAQIMMAQNDQATYEARYKAAEEKQRALEKEVQQLSLEKVDAIDKIAVLKNKLATQENQQIPSDAAGWETAEAAYKEEIQLLKIEAESLRLALDNASKTTAIAASHQENASQNTNSLAAMEARMQALEAQIAAIGQASQSSITEAEVPAPSRPMGTPHRPVVGTPAVAVDASGEPTSIRADVTQAGARKNTSGQTEVVVEGGHQPIAPLVGASSSGLEDNLQAIKNIGPFLQEKLQSLGIVSYAQIAAWSPEDIDDVTTRIGYLPGRIHLDDWVGQAKALVGLKAPKPAIPTNAKNQHNDLKQVEGIGPKIEELLKAHGINQLAQLSESRVDSLQEILKNAGTSYQMHDPSLWPAQAAQLMREE